MHRREFITVGAGSALLGSAVRLGGTASAGEAVSPAGTAPRVLASSMRNPMAARGKIAPNPAPESVARGEVAGRFVHPVLAQRALRPPVVGFTRPW